MFETWWAVVTLGVLKLIWHGVRLTKNIGTNQSGDIESLTDIYICSLLKLETTQAGIWSDRNFNSDTEADFVNLV